MNIIKQIEAKIISIGIQIVIINSDVAEMYGASNRTFANQILLP